MHTTFKKTITAALAFVLAAMTINPLTAFAFGNGDWGGRKKITLDTTESGSAIQQALPQSLVLVRLHSGNFMFADVKPDGGDIRFVAADDKTPLQYQVEKFDAANDVALIWVQVPNLKPASKTDYIWMYYGNEKVGTGEDAKALFDVNQVANYHFSENDGAPKDQTAYANNSARFTATRNTGSLIGSGASFNGSSLMSIPAAPSLKFGGSNGFTFSAWVKIAAPQKGALLFELREGGKRIAVGMEGTQVYALADAGEGAKETPRTAEIAPGQWHHVAVAGEKRLTVYVDGKEVAAIDASLPEIQGEIVVGNGFSGDLDELGLANVARTADWVKVNARGQGPDAQMVSIGEPESGESGESGEASYVTTILHSVTLDGWVVIAILMVMAAISWMVMVVKALVINRAEKDNRQFVAAFHELKLSETTRLDQADSDEDSDLRESALSTALFGKHDHYQNSTLYRIYHTGAQELIHRFGSKADRHKKVLSPQAIDAIKSSLDATLVRETQKLNSLMVLLTIAISGGPFLGLLGTVVGVMITFAAIAATGDVNVAAIAPGIAAALVATVAGLVVAIPALFGYNYLGSKIKNLTADMHVFVDEFVGRIAETHS
ncbi:MAG: MotA/TolQ/ExbB proton channel family protein [Sulfuricella sp.]|jgi:biopolymer transport protein ExbB